MLQAWQHELKFKSNRLVHERHHIHETHNQKLFYRDEQDGQDKTVKNRLLGLNQRASRPVFDPIRIDPLYPC